MSYVPSLIVIPHRILYLEGVQLSYVKVYEHIFHLWNQRKPCFISNPEFARRTGLGISTVQEALAFFEERGEILREFKGRRRYLKQPELSIEIGDDDRSDSDHPPEIADGSHPNQQMVATRDSRPYKDIRITKLNKTNLINSCSSDDELNSEEECFNRFWESYPRKEAKQAAMKAWKKIKQKDYEQIINDITLRQTHNWKGKSKQYIPLPASYLNGKRWCDELTQGESNNAQSKSEKSFEILTRIHNREAAREQAERNGGNFQDSNHKALC